MKMKKSVIASAALCSSLLAAGASASADTINNGTTGVTNDAERIEYNQPYSYEVGVDTSGKDGLLPETVALHDQPGSVVENNNTDADKPVQRDSGIKVNNPDDNTVSANEPGMPSHPKELVNQSSTNNKNSSVENNHSENKNNSSITNKNELNKDNKKVDSSSTNLNKNNNAVADLSTTDVTEKSNTEKENNNNKYDVNADPVYNSSIEDATSQSNKSYSGQKNNLPQTGDNNSSKNIISNAVAIGLSLAVATIGNLVIKKKY